jgi:hypothetical protein
VNFFHHTAIRKIAAGLLLALFTFIYAEKVFHGHDKAAVSVAKATAVIKSVTNNCAICDFQLTKDSVIPALASTNCPSIIFQQQFIVASVFYYHIPSSYISNKGPPVI